MSSAHQAPEHDTKGEEISNKTLPAFYGVHKKNLPDSGTGEGMVMKKMVAAMPYES